MSWVIERRIAVSPGTYEIGVWWLPPGVRTDFALYDGPVPMEANQKKDRNNQDQNIRFQIKRKENGAYEFINNMWGDVAGFQPGILYNPQIQPARLRLPEIAPDEVEFYPGLQRPVYGGAVDAEKLRAVEARLNEALRGLLFDKKAELTPSELSFGGREDPKDPNRAGCRR